MKDFKKLAAIALTMSLAACGGGGGSSGSSDKPDSLPDGKTNGSAYDGPLSNATIKAYDYDDGKKGKFLGSTTTDTAGNYSLKIQHVDSIILLEATNGQYPEEATGRSVSLSGDQQLQAVVQYKQGKKVNVQLTHHTTWAACYARYRKRALNENTVNSVIRANEVLTNLAGVPITATRPVDVTKAESVSPVLTSGHKAGFLAAGISQLVNATQVEDGVSGDNSLYTSINFSKIACRDIEADGLFNGIGPTSSGNPSGQLYLGNKPLSADFYRTRIGQEILNFANSDNNRTGLSSTDLLEYANNIALNSHDIFDGVEPSGVDQDGPSIVSSITDGHLISGDSAEVAFEITDPLGVNKVTFYLNGELLGDGSITTPVALIDTTQYDDGEYFLRVVARDSLNNESQLDLMVNIVNTGPGITFTSPTLTNQTGYTVAGEYVENGASIAEIDVNGVKATLNSDNNTWEAIIPLIGGDNLVHVEATDELDNTRVLEQVVKVDQISPVLNGRDTRARFSDFSGQLNLCEFGDFIENNNPSRPLCLSAERVSLNGAQVARSLTNDGYILVGLDMEDPQGQGVFTGISDLLLEYQVTLNGEVTVDWNEVPRPDRTDRTAYIPVTTEYFGDNFFTVNQSDLFIVKVRLADMAGNESELEIAFTLDVLTPAFSLQTRIANGEIFDTPFAVRNALNSTALTVEYIWENSSYLPYLIQVDSSESHQVQQTYEGAQRQNLARDVANEQWQIQKCDHRGNRHYDIDEARNCAFYGTGWSGYETVTSLRIGYEDETPDTRVEVSSYRNVYSDTVEPRTPGSWSTSVSRFSQQMKLGCSTSDVREECFDGDFYHSDSRSFGAMYYAAEDGRQGSEINFRSRNVYTVEYAEGYPRNNISRYESSHSVNPSLIRVYNVTNAVEILPQNGWYEIPPNVEVRITKQITLPSINHHFDTRVSLNDSNIPYTYQIFEDLTIDYAIDTNITVTRAINPGSIDDVDQVSQTQSLHGDGIYNRSLARS